MTITVIRAFLQGYMGKEAVAPPVTKSQHQLNHEAEMAKGNQLLADSEATRNRARAEVAASRQQVDAFNARHTKPPVAQAPLGDPTHAARMQKMDEFAKRQQAHRAHRQQQIKDADAFRGHAQAAYNTRGDVYDARIGRTVANNEAIIPEERYQRERWTSDAHRGYKKAEEAYNARRYQEPQAGAAPAGPNSAEDYWAGIASQEGLTPYQRNYALSQSKEWTRKRDAVAAERAAAVEAQFAAEAKKKAEEEAAAKLPTTATAPTITASTAPGQPTVPSIPTATPTGLDRAAGIGATTAGLGMAYAMLHHPAVVAAKLGFGAKAFPAMATAANSTASAAAAKSIAAAKIAAPIYLAQDVVRNGLFDAQGNFSPWTPTQNVSRNYMADRNRLLRTGEVNMFNGLNNIAGVADHGVNAIREWWGRNRDDGLQARQQDAEVRTRELANLRGSGKSPEENIARLERLNNIREWNGLPRLTEEQLVSNYRQMPQATR
jgi:hypothetical protein